MTGSFEINLDVDPTIVNVVTDVLLSLLVLLWEVVIRWLSALDVKRRLRRKGKVYSFEPMGTVTHLRTGWSRLIGERKRKDSSSQRTWELSLLFSRGMLIGLCSAAMVLLHMLIDFGLDFRTEAIATSSTANYEFMTFQPRPEFISSMANYWEKRQTTDDIARNACADVVGRNAFDDCVNRYNGLGDFVARTVREDLSFTNNLYNSGSMIELDVIEGMKVEYSTVWTDTSADGVDNSCTLQEFGPVEGLAGMIPIEFSSPHCRVVDLDAYSLTIGTHVSQIRLTVRHGIDESILEGEDPTLTFKSYERAKDERQQKTKVSLLRDDVISPSTGGNFGRIDIDSGIVYTRGMAERLHIVNLGSAQRRATGSLGGPGLKIGRLDVENERSRTSDEPCWGLSHRDAFRKQTVELLTPEGEVCGSFIAGFTTGICFQKLTYAGGVRARMGTQRVQTIIALLPDEQGSRCYSVVREHFKEELEEEFESGGERTMLMLALDMQMFCGTFEAEGRKECVIGTDTYRFTGSEWVEDEETEPDEVIVRRSPVSATWFGIQMQNVDANINEDLLTNMAVVVGAYYHEVAGFLAASVVRPEIAGVPTHWAIPIVVGAMSSQWEEVSKEVVVFEPESKAVLKKQYLVGWIVLLVIFFSCLLACIVLTIIERIQCAREGVEITVPWTATGWISRILPYVDVKAGTTDIYSHEYTLGQSTAKPPRMDSVQDQKFDSKQSLPTLNSVAMIGFYASRQALQSDVNCKSFQADLNNSY